MGLDRRSFISLVAGGVVGSLCTPVIWKTLDDVSIWSQNWPWIPRLNYGEEKKLATLCKLGGDAYGIKVKTVAGNPVTAEGNPDHPLSLGGICPLGAASVQMLYSPARIKNPKIKDGNNFKDISWDDAEALLAEKLKEAGAATAMISGDETGSTAEILSGLVGKLGSQKSFFMPAESAPAAAAVQMLGGDGQVGYDLENAGYVLLLGADALGSWANVARNAKAFAASRDKAVRYVYVGPAQNGTTAVADAWIPCAAGTEPLLALGLAHIIASGRTSYAPGFADFERYVQAYQPETVAAATGVPAERIMNLAKELINAGRPLVLTASESGHGLGAYEAAAGMCLNMLLGQMNAPGGVRILPWAPKVVESAAEKKDLLANDLVAYLTAVADGQEDAPKVLLVHSANPAYALPNLNKVQSALDKAEFLVSFSTFMDETAVMADLILPDSYALERLDDSYSPYGAPQAIYTVAAPVTKPIYDTRAAGDVLLSVAAKADAELGFESFEAVISAKAEALEAEIDSLMEGTPWVSEEFPTQDLAFWSSPLKEIAVPAGAEKSVSLSVVTHLKIGSAAIATPPFGTNAIRFDEMKGKEMYVQLNAATASSLGVKKDDRIKLANAAGECVALVKIFEGVMSGTVVASLGFGHTAWDDFSRGKGDNIYKLLQAEAEPGTGVSRFGSAQVTISKA